MYKRVTKRIIDLTVSTLALAISSPILILTTIALTAVNRGNPFFFQRRPGRNEKIFKIIKFRTMLYRVDADGNLLPDNERLTRLGKLIRKTSIDELPQLINIIRGEMSLVGPRPLLPEYLELYNDIQKRRHEVKPGVTGLAQIRGRNKMLFSERLKSDVYYVDHVSFKLDMKILFSTIHTVFFKSGNVINAQDMEEVDDLHFTRHLKKANDNNR